MSTLKHKILIIEDEKPLARALEIKLTHEGFDVTVLSNGDDFEHVLSAGHFSLILSDLVMPHVDGFTILEILKNKKIKIPVFILTNLSQKEDEERVLSLGAKHFFIKTNTSLSYIVDLVKKELAH